MEGLYKIILYLFVCSLAISTVLATVMYVIMSFTKKLKVIVRYNVLITFLSLFVLAIFYIICVQINNAYFEINNQRFIGFTTLNTLTDINNYNIQLSQDSQLWVIIQNAYYKIYNYAFEIILLWYAIFCYKGFRLCLGLVKVKKLILKNKKTIETFWREKAIQCSSRLGIKKSINIYTSSTINSPMVLGFFKPIILVPIELITGMPASQLEAVIYHELAHIKRYDPIINLLQNVLEVIFFFNPPLLWLSNQAKIEREKCCDDMVLNVTNNKKDYVRALYFCAALNTENQDLSLAFANHNEVLLDRVRRILSNKENFYNKTQASLFYILSIVLFIITVAFTSASQLDKPSTDKDNTEQTSIKKTFIFTGITAEELSEEEGGNVVKMLKTIIMRMKNEGVIINDKALSFVLDKNKFIVNDKVLPSEIHERYKVKFIEKDDWRICYNYRIKL